MRRGNKEGNVGRNKLMMKADNVRRGKKWMERWMDGRNDAAARSILRSTICIQRGGILLMSVISPLPFL